jgi:hypothetical protein
VQRRNHCETRTFVGVANEVSTNGKQVKSLHLLVHQVMCVGKYPATQQDNGTFKDSLLY